MPKPRIYIYGWPGDVGGARTKIKDLLYLLEGDFELFVIAPDPAYLDQTLVCSYLHSRGIAFSMKENVRSHAGATLLALCQQDFFTSGTAQWFKDRGFRIVWSNEMMFLFDAEAEAVRSRVVDRVLFVSEFQKSALLPELGADVDHLVTGNYIDERAYPFSPRRNHRFTLGRLSRADVNKYPDNFPLTYESLRIPFCRFRVMAWSSDLKSRFSWHTFDERWELLEAGAESTSTFLQSLDLFVYNISSRVQESWGRAIVEAQLCGAVPLVPRRNPFGLVVAHNTSGYLCESFSDFQDRANGLYDDDSLRRRLAKEGREWALALACDRTHHLNVWKGALHAE